MSLKLRGYLGVVSPRNVALTLAPLQKALEKNYPKSAMPKGPMKPAMNMPADAGAGGMGGGGMKDSMMSMMSQMMGQMMPPMSPSQMNAAPSAGPSSELPGFAGASHIYHIGATGFFVDHSDMANFTTEQLGALNRLKEKSLLFQSGLDRKVLGAEQELWKLTASEQPVIKSVEAKVKEIELLKGQKRISFIRDVGEAARVLTPSQRSILLGTAPAKNSQKTLRKTRWATCEV